MLTPTVLNVIYILCSLFLVNHVNTFSGILIVVRVTNASQGMQENDSKSKSAYDVYEFQASPELSPEFDRYELQKSSSLTIADRSTSFSFAQGLDLKSEINRVAY